VSVLGLDIGTTGVKVVVIAADGRLLATSHREYPLVTSEPGWAELDPRTVWRASSQAIRQAVDGLQEAPDAIGLSAPGEAFLPVDDHCRPLGNAIVSFDQRSHADFESAMADLGARHFEEATTLRPLPHYAGFKWLWWKRHRPEVYAATRSFVGLGSYVAARLGAAPSIDPSLAIRTSLFDPAGGNWAFGLAERLGIDRDKLPAVGPADAPCGETSRVAARRLGLRAGIPIAIGGLDQACAAFAVGIAGSTAMLSIGTTAVVCVATPLRSDVAAGIPAVPHVSGGQWLAMAGTPSGGSVLRWYRSNVTALGRHRGTTVSSDFDAIVEPAADHPTSVLFLPHLSGSRIAFDDPGATGAFVGLTLAAGRYDLTRAVLDGVAYEIAMLLLRLRASGLVIESLRSVGGASRSRPWMQLISDATSLPIHSTATSHAAAFGAARLAGNLVDLAVPPLAGPSAHMDRNLGVPTTFTVEPRHGWHSYHAERFDQFRRTQAALRAARLNATNAATASP
jgi:xylulokinase